MDIKNLLTSNSQDWATPIFMYEIIIKNKYIDICPLHCEINCFDLKDWFKNTYCNPPYNNISTFIDRAIIEKNKGNVIVFLVPSRTDTQWFKKLYENNAEFYFIEGRLHFNESKSAPFPSMIAVLDINNELPIFNYIKKENLGKILDFICNNHKI